MLLAPVRVPVPEASLVGWPMLEEGAPDLEDGDLSELVLEPPGYLAILGYLPYSDAVDSGREVVVERECSAHTESAEQRGRG